MAIKEGNLEPPKREPIAWQDPEFGNKDSLYNELERVFDICHGCRRCVSLCDSFPTLFDLVDESDTLEVDGVDKDHYMNVVDQCFMCDLCAETKCPYLPPHEWALDFPHLMLRAKAYKFDKGGSKWRDRLITSTDTVFKTLANPVLAPVTNAVNGNSLARKAIDKAVGFHPDAPMPKFQTSNAAKTIVPKVNTTPTAGTGTTGKVAIYVTCYGESTDHKSVADLVAVLEHNGVQVKLLQDAKCCGMPKLELGDLKKVAALKDANLPTFLAAIEEGYDIIAPIPSCVLMYKQELPLMFPEDAAVKKVEAAFYDPFEYLVMRHKDNLLNTEFKTGLGKVAYHAACHQRVQNFGSKTRELLSLIPDTDVTAIERCSGHDGTYALKSETYHKAMKILKPVVRRVAKEEPDTFGSDCPMAGQFIAHGMHDAGHAGEAEHPISMVRRAYGV